MLDTANWIMPIKDYGDVCPAYGRLFVASDDIEKATLEITALGVYEALLNGERVGEFIMAPGWTSYQNRIQVQTYDITGMIKKVNRLEVTVAPGWYHSPLYERGGTSDQDRLMSQPKALIAKLTVSYKNGSAETVVTDRSWGVCPSRICFSEIYDGEIYDARLSQLYTDEVEIYTGKVGKLIPTEGEIIKKHETFEVRDIITTPKGETVLDFGQEITGYIETTVYAKAGDIIDLSFAEILDKDGNFYNDNYRSIKGQYRYICRDGMQIFEPKHTFWCFRYVRVNVFRDDLNQIKKSNFKAVCVYSDIRRTARMESSSPLLNRFIDNVFWGQKDNFLDVPLDCPQRNERLGWTGDALAFIKAACINFDVERFFVKWFRDMTLDQNTDGSIPGVIPNVRRCGRISAGYADVAVIGPWEVYKAYGNGMILEEQFECMKKWIGYVSNTTKDEYLWTGGTHYGDWLGLDAPEGTKKGASRDDFIASAYYAYSTSVFVKVGETLGRDMTEYRDLFEKIRTRFRETFRTLTTQTECVIAAAFDLWPDPRAAVDQLAEMIHSCGDHLMTGFIGTPYILHVLSHYGYIDLAWDLMLREKCPSWLYPVKNGATTVWEHWDGIKEDGSLWDSEMNSFNHYSYGSVIDWLYKVACGIGTDDRYPGYGRIIVEPHPTDRLDYLKTEIETRNGKVSSSWEKTGSGWKYVIEVPVDSDIIINGRTHSVSAGSYTFFE